MKRPPGPCHANDSAHETHAADPAFGVDEEWCSSVRNESGDVVACAYGPDADAAIALARLFAKAPEMLEVLRRLDTATDEDGDNEARGIAREIIEEV